MVAVSVITPVRDAAPWLWEAIASVQAQTVADWELLIVDDGSTDGGREVAARAAQADRRIRTFATVGGRGAAAARNLGLANARGEFVAFLDADDLFEPDKLATDLSALAAHPTAAMVYGPTRWWWPDGSRPPKLESMALYADRLHAPTELFRRVLVEQKGEVPCTCAVLVQRSAVAAVGGFEEAFALYEDQTLWAKLMLRWPTYVHAVATSRYRQHAGSASAAAARDGLYDPVTPHAPRAEFLKWALREAKATGQADPKLLRALRLALAHYPADCPPLSPVEHGLLLARGVEWRIAKLRRRFRRQQQPAPTS